MRNLITSIKREKFKNFRLFTYSKVYAIEPAPVILGSIIDKLIEKKVKPAIYWFYPLICHHSSVKPLAIWQRWNQHPTACSWRQFAIEQLTESCGLSVVGSSMDLPEIKARHGTRTWPIRISQWLEIPTIWYNRSPHIPRNASAAGQWFCGWLVKLYFPTSICPPKAEHPSSQHDTSSSTQNTVTHGKHWLCT